MLVVYVAKDGNKNLIKAQNNDTGAVFIGLILVVILIIGFFVIRKK